MNARVHGNATKGGREERDLLVNMDSLHMDTSCVCSEYQILATL